MRHNQATPVGRRHASGRDAVRRRVLLLVWIGGGCSINYGVRVLPQFEPSGTVSDRPVPLVRARGWSFDGFDMELDGNGEPAIPAQEDREAARRGEAGRREARADESDCVLRSARLVGKASGLLDGAPSTACHV